MGSSFAGYNDLLKGALTTASVSQQQDSLMVEENHWVDFLVVDFFGSLDLSSNLRNQQLQAVGTGLTLIRCISQSISGVIESVILGHFEQKTTTMSNQVVPFNLPIQKRRKTQGFPLCLYW
ncbi:hypothetical protein BCR42DRAFT_453993 [Absidia repens]|uniref:Uncharacterized protein n=1 Tax=Absidia repens TaxID=90262 RepID=A0A1X2I868_9FUNG|nr:hypothetical protein BCR42DRAFT_453993 [Absidia repens]